MSFVYSRQPEVIVSTRIHTLSNASSLDARGAVKSESALLLATNIYKSLLFCVIRVVDFMIGHSYL